MKATKRPLPTPWTADTAVLHLYGAWSNRGLVRLHEMELPNPSMVQALLSLWEHERQQRGDPAHEKVVSGVVTGLGTWHLHQRTDGTGTIVIEPETKNKRSDPLDQTKEKWLWQEK
ncbi:hypothetical protein KDA_75840 [Dictyobacter alpinus]|uniref:Uncharacterized protein n=1 Tax=Dictyobacter alpinus TaxID=2014873 RepID=A0A402BLB1_9CHLR|nr:hypothetical protein [Dictyobacter alpinus]GCE32100.1 hypothetical protein KDA_75840 [Dictyobacter alpinus]